MKTQRPLNQALNNLARDGAKKATVNSIPVKPGMVRQTKGEIAFHGGVTVDDLPNSKIIKSHTKPIGFHSGMTDKQVAKAGHGATSGQVLENAERLGQPDNDSDGDE